MHVIKVMAMVIDCYRIEAVIHVIDLMAMLMEVLVIVIGLKH